MTFPTWQVPTAAVSPTRGLIHVGGGPNRVPTSIYVDAKNPNHAWILLLRVQRENAGHAWPHFQRRLRPERGTATFTSIDGSIGDMPINSVVRDDPTGDLYASNDSAFCACPREAPRGRPRAPECQRRSVRLTISTKGRVLYAATHGRGGYALQLP